MKFFLDFFPVAIFVGVYVFSPDENPMYPAVIALMIAVVIQNIGTRLLTGKFEKLHLWTLVITLVMGGLTLFFRDPAFIFWKASVLVWVTAIVFLYRQHILGKVLLEEMLSKAVEEKIDAPTALWGRLNHIWATVYTLFGFLNLYVAYSYSESFWVQFKLFGLMGMNLILLVYVMVKIYPYLPLEEIEQEDDSNQTQGNAQAEELYRPEDSITPSIEKKE
ncbi:MAG: septation protein IspZ [Kangiellaceae bacterium]|nr:septation protein IspZ [Kangiellaceae bacterium]